MRPLSRTILGGAGCQQAFESGVDEPPPLAAPGGLLAGLGADPRPWPERTRARDATEGATPGPWRPSCRTTLTGPWPRAREPLRGRAYCHRLVRGRPTQTSRTGPGAAGPGPAQPPAPRRGHGPLRAQQRPCARSPARRPTWPAPHAERHRATGRWQGEHRGRAGSFPLTRQAQPKCHHHHPNRHRCPDTPTVTDLLRHHRSEGREKGTFTLQRYVHVVNRRRRLGCVPCRPPGPPRRWSLGVRRSPEGPRTGRPQPGAITPRAFRTIGGLGRGADRRDSTVLRYGRREARC